MFTTVILLVKLYLLVLTINIFQGIVMKLEIPVSQQQ